MSRSKKTRKQGKLTTFLPTGPSKTELLADPNSRESRRKQALDKKRRQQRSLKKGAANEQAAADAAKTRRQPRLTRSPEEVAEATRALIESKKKDDEATS